MKRIISKSFLYLILSFLTVVFVFPIILVLINSFKSRFVIQSSPFSLPDASTFAGFSNYIRGIQATDFLMSLGRSLFITVFSVALIVICCSMTAWFIERIKGALSNFLYYIFVFSMVVPFQMVMFTMSKVANVLGLDNPVGIIFIYLGFGAGLSIFMFCGAIKGLPRGVEEAAWVDGCSVIKMFFSIVLPLLKPTLVTVAILNAMWIWNDYLLPYLVMGSDYRTVPVAVQYLKGGYGSVDMGALMAVLIIAVIPVTLFYLFTQKFIIEGVAAGAVKG